MKQIEMIAKLKALGHHVEPIFPAKKRWTFLGTGESHFDLTVLKFDDFSKLVPYATETGVIAGPVSTQRRQYFKIYGFLFLVGPHNMVNIASTSLMRNSRYRFVSKQNLLTTKKNPRKAGV